MPASSTSFDHDGKDAAEGAAQHWIQCDRCNKWRRVAKSVVDGIGDDDAWYAAAPPALTTLLLAALDTPAAMQVL